MLKVYNGTAQPWQCDAMGHMTTRFYVGMFDDSIYHFLNEVFNYRPNTSDWENIGWADARHVIEYKSEVLAGDLLSIYGKLERIGNKSAGIYLEMRNISTNIVVSTMNLDIVLFDLETRKPAPITESIRMNATKHME